MPVRNIFHGLGSKTSNLDVDMTEPVINEASRDMQNPDNFDNMSELFAKWSLGDEAERIVAISKACTLGNAALLKELKIKDEQIAAKDKELEDKDKKAKVAADYIASLKKKLKSHTEQIAALKAKIQELLGKNAQRAEEMRENHMEAKDRIKAKRMLAE
ncbi:hypothetical protein K491DRAFT_762278 [Lophiostoma macrostomum CBS 122681]|uniref:Uncharacterized protein n=1 Tax=Lophiostoma macrostomum CBS 122681 TaxID=1314788 RepID=A0A6A6SP32_9PLEO|nr:hypothetical protein K491DRAFT_762278 [Lophiostoma macrostomum CBS 122681]